MKIAEVAVKLIATKTASKISLLIISVLDNNHDADVAAAAKKYEQQQLAEKVFKNGRQVPDMGDDHQRKAHNIKKDDSKIGIDFAEYNCWCRSIYSWNLSR